jgi:hypothetical protein
LPPAGGWTLDPGEAREALLVEKRSKNFGGLARALSQLNA